MKPTMTRTLLTATLLSAAIALSACGGGGNGSSSGNNNTGSGNTGGGNTGGQATVLEGNWEYLCKDEDPDNNPGQTYSKGTITFTGNQAVADSSFFSDSNCTTPLNPPGLTDNRIILTETFTIGADVTTSGGLSAKEIDSTTVSLAYADGALLPSAFQPTGADADDFDIFHIDANGDLFFGDDENDTFDGSTAADRPRKLDFGTTFRPGSGGNSGGGNTTPPSASLTLSGADTTVIGQSFTPSGSVTDQDGATGETQKTWEAGQNTAFKTREFVLVRDTADLSTATFINIRYFPEPTGSLPYAYEADCETPANPCSGVTLDLNARSITLSDVTLVPAGFLNQATAPIVVNGTLNW